MMSEMVMLMASSHDKRISADCLAIIAPVATASMHVLNRAENFRAEIAFTEYFCRGFILYR